MLRKSQVLVFVLAFIVSSKTVQAQSSQQNRKQPARIEQQVPGNSPLLMQASIDDLSGYFLVDTGASLHALDLELFSDSNPKGQTNLRTPRGVKKVPALGDKKYVRVDSTLYSLNRVVCCDLDPLTKVIGCKIAGVIGLPVIADHGLGFDSSKKSFYLGVRKNTNYDRQYGVRLINSTLYTNSVELADETSVDFLLDTGLNAALSLNPNRFDNVISKGLATDIRNQSTATLEGYSQVRSAVLLEISVFGQVFQNVPIIESGSDAIGLCLLKRFDFYLDIKRSTIHVTTSANSTEPFLVDQSGLSLIRDEGKIVVYSVRKSSPADRIGICNGDVVLAINNKPVEAGWESLHEIREIFSNPTSFPVNLEILTGSEAKHLIINLNNRANSN